MPTVERSAPAPLRINCPKCHLAGAPAHAYDEVERAYGHFRYLPYFLSKRTTWVVCDNCRAKLLSSKWAAELAGLSPEQLNEVLSPRVYLITQVLAVGAVVLAVIPLVGTLTGLVAVAVNWRDHGWRKKTSIAGLALSILFPIGLILTLKLTGQ